MVKVKISKILVKPEDIKPSSKKFEVIGVLNPAAIRLKNRKILLYVRVIERLKKFKDFRYYYSPRFVGKDKYRITIDKFPKSKVAGGDDFGFDFKNKTKRLTCISHLRRIFIDEKGFKILKIEQKPGFYGLLGDGELGIEDARIVEIENKYYMTYVGLSRREGISTYIAVSDNCIEWKRLGIIFGQQDKDVVLFPEKIKGKYVTFDRPEGNFEFSIPHIWIAYSNNLLHWGELKSVNLSLKHEDFDRIGAGPPPIKIDKGWLFLFHAVTALNPSGFQYSIKKVFGIKVEEGPPIYAVWVALLDKDNPGKLIARSNHPIIVPTKKYEISLEGKRVIFPTGLVSNDNCKSLLVYSGAGDKVISVKEIRLKDIMKELKRV